MKNFILLAAISFAFLTTEAIAQMPQMIKVPLQAAFIPNGFDNNDRAQLVVSAVLPNTCFKAGPHYTKVDHGTRSVTVSQMAYQYPGPCLDVIVPFTEVVDLGILSAGNYTVFDEATRGILGTVGVGKSKTVGPDDHLYAPVTDMQLIQSAGGRQIILSGAFTDNCMLFKNIHVSWNSPKVILVLPVVDRAKKQGCTRGYFPFQRVVNLNFNGKGQYLIHVRSLNGQALNKVVDLL